MANVQNTHELFGRTEFTASIVRSVWRESALGKLVTPSLVNTGHTIVCPSLTLDGAAWVNEGEEITVADSNYSEVSAPVRKVAALTLLSTEVMDQLQARAREGSTEELFSAYAEAMYSLNADLAQAVDIAFCQDLSANGKAPLGALATDGVTQVEGGLTVDAIVDANSNALALTGVPAAGVLASVAAVADLARTKASDGSNEYLYSYDADGSLNVQGVKVVPTPAIAEGVDAIVVPRQGLVVGGLREGRLERSVDYAFNQDAVALRGVVYAAFAFGIPAATTVVKSAA